MNLPARIAVWLTVGLGLAVPLGLMVTDSTEPIVVERATVAVLSVAGDPGPAVPRAMITATYQALVLRDVSSGVMAEVGASCQVWTNGQSVDAGGFIRPLASTELNYDRGPNTIGVSNAIPMNAVPGRLEVRGELRWSCNPWQRLFPKVTALPVLVVDVVVPA